MNRDSERNEPESGSPIPGASKEPNSDRTPHATRSVESRRRFIQGLTATAAATFLSKSLDRVFADPSDANEVDHAATPPRRPARSKVVRLTDRKLIPERVVQGALLRTSLADGMQALTGEGTYADAFQKLLKPDDVILIKFNRSAASQLATSEAMCIALVNLLFNSGFHPDQIMLLEASREVTRALGTRPADERWQGKIVEFGRSGRDSFIAALEEATAIINVPFLKTHHLARMTSCLKNLSHGLIRHPARFHGNGCDPAIAEIVATPEIRSKLKLNIVNALRVPFDKGPEAEESDTDSSGILIMGPDPVACDAVGYAALNQIRARYGLPALLGPEQIPRQLISASDLGVGQYDEGQISLQSLPA